MMFYKEKKESVWTRLENDCDIDELIYDVQTNQEAEEIASDR